MSKAKELLLELTTQPDLPESVKNSLARLNAKWGKEQRQKDLIDHRGDSASVINELKLNALFLEEKIQELQELVQWMMGCGYDFTQHEIFNEGTKDLMRIKSTINPEWCIGCTSYDCPGGCGKESNSDIELSDELVGGREDDKVD